jgi:hypothetical protein
LSNVTDIRTRGLARPGQPLPPLKRRHTRILLLAASYHDACEALSEGTRAGGKPGSRLLVRNSLWTAGSYADLERLLDELRAGATVRSVELNHRALYRAFWATYVGQRFPLGYRSDSQKVRDAALHALGWIERRMPASIFVPPDIAEAAGYMPSDAAAYARPRRLAI